jgi:Leucine Rich repeat
LADSQPSREIKGHTLHTRNTTIVARRFFFFLLLPCFAMTSLPFRNFSPRSVLDDIQPSPSSATSSSSWNNSILDPRDRHQLRGCGFSDNRLISKARALHDSNNHDDSSHSFDYYKYNTSEECQRVAAAADQGGTAVREQIHHVVGSFANTFRSVRSTTLPSPSTSHPSSSSTTKATTTSLKRKLPYQSSLSPSSPSSQPSTKMNLRHRLVCRETVQWLADAGRSSSSSLSLPSCAHTCSTASASTTNTSTATQTMIRSSSSTRSSSSPAVVEELWLGPVFESSETILSAIRTLPSTVTYLDLDLRNALHLLPQALPLLLSKTHVKTLSVRVFGDAGAIELAKWIHKNPNLERLNLQGNRIGSLGARTLVDAIIACGHHHKLKHLNLSCNCILHGDLIGQLLAMSTSLESIDLQFNWLGDQDVKHICQGLCKNTSLRELNLHGCSRVTKSGLQTLMTCLERHNTSLHTVTAQAFDDESDKIVDRINYWTSLNKFGRYLIHRLPSLSSSSSGEQDGTVPPGLWPHVLEKSKDQPNILNYLLRHGSPKILDHSTWPSR